MIPGPELDSLYLAVRRSLSACEVCQLFSGVKCGLTSVVLKHDRSEMFYNALYIVGCLR